MTDTIPHHALAGYEPAKGLLPIAPALAANLVIHPGDRIAFREDHPEFGSAAAPGVVDNGLDPKDPGYQQWEGLVRPEVGEGEAPRRAAYGIVQAVGFDRATGDVRFDVAVFDPHDGAPDEGAEIRRISMEDIQ